MTEVAAIRVTLDGTSPDTDLQLTLDGGAEPVDGRRLEGGHSGGAVFSPCRRYRYNLTRMWGPGGRLVLWIMLNPSTADEKLLDPTLRRCRVFSEAWGFDGMHVRNLFAFRATDPKVMVAMGDEAVGPENDRWLSEDLDRFGLVVCGWGATKTAHDRGQRVLELVRGAGQVPHALTVTKSGDPGHPLYLPGELQPVPLAA